MNVGPCLAGEAAPGVDAQLAAVVLVVAHTCVCLSCHFDMGLFHVLGQEVPQLTLLMTLLYYLQ